MTSTEGRVAIVSGAGRGIARLLSQRLAQDGFRVAVCDIASGPVRETADRIGEGGGEAAAFAVDITDEEAVAGMVASVVDRWGRIDLLVNAAGAYGAGFRKTHETPLEEWNKVLSSNLTGYFLCAKHVLPVMQGQRSGRIINFASNAGRSVSPLLGASYTAAKTAVIGLTRHLAHEYAPDGILVNTIAPGPVEGERVRDLLSGDGGTGGLATKIPLGRLASEEDVADVVMFMASDASRYMTGAILDVNGGYVLA